jgi:hypothetical protein
MVPSDKQFARSVLTIVAITAVAGGAQAGPDITVTRLTGEFVKDGQLVIEGVDFGEKNPALPRLWDDFEGHTVGTAIGTPVQGVYTRTTGTVYSDEAPYAGTRCAFSDISLESGVEGMGLVSHWIPEEANRGFASMKWKIVSAAGSLAPHNIKLIRLNAHDPDPTHGYPNYNIGCERGYTGFSGIVNHGLMGQVYLGGFSDAEYTYGGWNSIAIWDIMGDPDQPNGMAGRRINGATVQRDGIVTLQSGHLSGLRAAYFCGYLSHDGSDARLYLDDVYADVTLARVEVHGASGVREMQIPVDWSPNRVEILCNPGLYQPGQTVNLVVFDADGNASPPYQFEIGGEITDPGAPGQPGQPVR